MLATLPLEKRFAKRFSVTLHHILRKSFRVVHEFFVHAVREDLCPLAKMQASKQQRGGDFLNGSLPRVMKTSGLFFCFFKLGSNRHTAL